MIYTFLLIVMALWCVVFFAIRANRVDKAKTEGMKILKFK